jgi:hypothetical protein
MAQRERIRHNLGLRRLQAGCAKRLRNGMAAVEAACAEALEPGIANDPLAVLRVPPTAQQVIEYIYEELEHAIFMACSSDELAAVAPLLKKAQAAAERILAERILAERGSKPRIPPPSAA